MARLEDEQKRYLVRRNACYIAPDKIRQEFHALYSIKLTDAQISQYDPTTANGDRDMGEELKAFFFEVRDKYIHDEEAVPIAHRAFRLNRLQELLKHPIAQESPRLEMAIHEQAAKERGGFFEKPKPPVVNNDDADALTVLRKMLGVKNDNTPDTPETSSEGEPDGESPSPEAGEATVELGAA